MLFKCFHLKLIQMWSHFIHYFRRFLGGRELINVVDFATGYKK